MQYDALGRRTSLSYPNRVTTNYTYDNTSNLLNLQHLNPLNQILESLTYTYDPNGNRMSMDRLNNPVKLPNPAANATYNAANQMLTFNDKSMTYDENGNMRSVTDACGITMYTWDARNRLASMQGFAPGCTAITASFKYDALGRRISKIINGRTIQFLYDGQDIVQEIEQGVAKVNYLRTLSIDEPLVRVDSGGAVRYYHLDALGSVIALADEGMAIRTRYMYDPFGTVTLSGETVDNQFQYTGRENDASGLYYYRARYYSSQLQRFISEDPIRFRGGRNFYAYVRNSPLAFRDPRGLYSPWFDPNVDIPDAGQDAPEPMDPGQAVAAAANEAIRNFEIPGWVCDVGVHIGCHILCEEWASPLVCIPACVGAAALACGEKCH